MSIVGSDDFADAPALAVGTASAYTPNTGYTTEPDEPDALVGRTAWWRFQPTAPGAHFVDALYSRTSAGFAASTQVWVYLSETPTPALGDLTLRATGGVNERLGFLVNPTIYYFIRVDAVSTAAVSYCVALGVETFDDIKVRYPLGGVGSDPFPGDDIPVVDDHFATNASFTGTPEEEAAYTGAIVGNTEMVGGADALDRAESMDPLAEEGGYAELDTEGFYEADVFGGPLLLLVSSSAGHPEIEPPPAEEYDLVGASLVVVAAATVAQSLRHAILTDTLPISIGGAAVESSVDLPFGDWTEHVVDLTHSHVESALLEDYNAGTLEISVTPYDTDLPEPQGIWRFDYLGIEFWWQSVEPLPYIPPPAPPFAVVSVTRLFPRKDAYGPMGSAPRLIGNIPPERIVGGHM